MIPPTMIETPYYNEEKAQNFEQTVRSNSRTRGKSQPKNMGKGVEMCSKLQE